MTNTTRAYVYESDAAKVARMVKGWDNARDYLPVKVKTNVLICDVWVVAVYENNNKLGYLE